MDINYELEKLNTNQKKAVTHENGPLFVVAGAGTGKTKTLTTRIAYLINKLKVNEERILGVTFTNKAASEIRSRVNSLIVPTTLGQWLYTFHAFGLRVLREHATDLDMKYNNNFNIIDEDDALSIVRNIIKNANLDSKRYTPRLIRNMISNHKTKISEITDDNILDLCLKYVNYLETENLMDFDDLIVYTYKLFKTKKSVLEKYQQKFEHVLVDEFQDTDRLQYEIIKLLNNKNTFVVGDPDQSIYGFRGARYENNELFIKDFKAEKLVLDKNYRSTNNILKKANLLIKNNHDSNMNKELFSDFGDGSLVSISLFSDDYNEVNFIYEEIKRLVNNGYLYSDIAILYRNNNLSRMFEHTFTQLQIPYVIYGGMSFYERKEIKDMLAYLRLALDYSQNFYLKRIVNVPSRGIGNVTISKIEDYSYENNISIFSAIDMVKVSKATEENLEIFKKVIVKIQSKILEVEDLSDIVDVIFKESNYKEELEKEFPDKKEERKDNIMELKSVFRQASFNYEGTNIEKLTSLLDEIALYTDKDKKDPNSNSVKLATIHQVKGLEFKVVFVVALEEGIFPSERAYNNTHELKEERRVFYVALTRAKERLYVSSTKRRMLYGKINYNNKSIFLDEIKKDEETVVKSNMRLTSNYVEETVSTYKPGDIINHDSFGKGVVVSINGDIVTIAFSIEYGIKKLLINHPSIKKVK